MEKVICDVCGTSFPETDDQCPVCGCARSDNRQTSADNTSAEEQSGYAYTKGGRFSKSNVRKRLKAAQIQPVPVEIPVRNPEPQEQEYDDYDEYDEEEDEQTTSNKGLVVIVVLLLLAIIAVSSYIAIVHFDIFGMNDPTVPAGTTAPTNQTTAPTDPTGTRVPCTGLTVEDKIALVEKGSVMQLSFSVDPIDTTDSIQFVSADETVATVDATGRVTAVGNGETTITITCGDFVKVCTVTCVLDGGTEPSDPTDPSEPEDPHPDFVLELNRTDFTLNKKGTYHTLYRGEVDASEITWTSKNENVATVVDGKVTAVGVGRTEIVAEYKGQRASCWVSCRWDETTEPEQPVDPDNPAETYTFYIGNEARLKDADISIFIGDRYEFKIENSEGRIMDVTWTASAEGVCRIDGKYVIAEAEGRITVSGTYDGQTFTCIVRVYKPRN